MAENGIGASVPRTEDHRFLTGTGDYTMARADDLPDLTVETTCTPCPHNPWGSRGAARRGQSPLRPRS